MPTTSIDSEALKTALRIGGATALAFLALVSVWASMRPAAAEESQCASWQEVRQALAGKFAEAPMATGVVVGATVLSEPAYPAEAQKADRLDAPQVATAPLPKATPESGPVSCALLLARVTELDGWRVFTGDKAVKYIRTAFATHPPADAMAYAVNGDFVGVLVAKDGCVVGRKVIKATMHRAVMDKAFGIVA